MVIVVVVTAIVVAVLVSPIAVAVESVAVVASVVVVIRAVGAVVVVATAAISRVGRVLSLVAIVSLSSTLVRPPRLNCIRMVRASIGALLVAGAHRILTVAGDGCQFGTAVRVTSGLWIVCVAWVSVASVASFEAAVCGGCRVVVGRNTAAEIVKERIAPEGAFSLGLVTFTGLHHLPLLGTLLH